MQFAKDAGGPKTETQEPVDGVKWSPAVIIPALNRSIAKIEAKIARLWRLSNPARRADYRAQSGQARDAEDERGDQSEDGGGPEGPMGEGGEMKDGHESSRKRG